MGRRVPGGMVEVGVLVVALAGAAALAGCAASAGGGASQAAARPAAQAAVATASGAAAEVADGSPLAAADRPERLAYAGPGGPAGQSADRLVAQPPGRVVDQVQEALRTAGLRIGQVDERAGLVVATYTGDPSRFVDCGTIIAATDGGDARRLDAAAEGANFRRSSNRRPVLVERGLTLRARLVLQLRPEGQGTRLTSRATYVLTKRTSLDGGPARLETISFQSGGRAGFAKGTICQPTSALERLALVPAAGA